MKLRCFEELSLLFRCAFQDFSAQGRFAVCKGLSCSFVNRRFPFYSVGPPSPAGLCGFFGFLRRKLQTIGSHRLIILCPVQQERLTLIGTSQLKLTSHRWPKETLHQVYLCKSLCWKKVFMVCSVLSQHSCSRSLPLSFTSASPR